MLGNTPPYAGGGGGGDVGVLGLGEGKERLFPIDVREGKAFTTAVSNKPRFCAGRMTREKEKKPVGLQ